MYSGGPTAFWKSWFPDLPSIVSCEFWSALIGLFWSNLRSCNNNNRACLILLKGGFSFVLSISFVEQVCTPVNQACNLIEASYLSGGVSSLTFVHRAATTMSSITSLSKIHFPHNLRKRLKFWIVMMCGVSPAVNVAREIFNNLGVLVARKLRTKEVIPSLLSC